MKNLYITRGTPEFMEKVKEKYAGENMILMHGSGSSQLLHETAGKTVFQTPQRYEVIEEMGQLKEHGFFALNNISVSDEGKPIFEERFKRDHLAMKDTSGFIAFRLLRSIDSDTYIILTEWEDSQSFDLHKNTPAFLAAYDTTKSDIVAGPSIHIFSSAPYITLFSSLQTHDSE